MPTTDRNIQAQAKQPSTPYVAFSSAANVTAHLKQNADAEALSSLLYSTSLADDYLRKWVLATYVNTHQRQFDLEDYSRDKATTFTPPVISYSTYYKSLSFLAKTRRTLRNLVGMEPDANEREEMDELTNELFRTADNLSRHIKNRALHGTVESSKIIEFLEMAESHINKIRLIDPGYAAWLQKTLQPMRQSLTSYLDKKYGDYARMYSEWAELIKRYTAELKLTFLQLLRGLNDKNPEAAAAKKLYLNIYDEETYHLGDFTKNIDRYCEDIAKKLAEKISLLSEAQLAEIKSALRQRPINQHKINTLLGFDPLREAVPTLRERSIDQISEDVKARLNNPKVKLSLPVVTRFTSVAIIKQNIEHRILDVKQLLRGLLEINFPSLSQNDRAMLEKIFLKETLLADLITASAEQNTRVMEFLLKRANVAFEDQSLLQDIFKFLASNKDYKTYHTLIMDYLEYLNTLSTHTITTTEVKPAPSVRSASTITAALGGGAQAQSEPSEINESDLKTAVEKELLRYLHAAKEDLRAFQLEKSILPVIPYKLSIALEKLIQDQILIYRILQQVQKRHGTINSRLEDKAKGMIVDINLLIKENPALVPRDREVNANLQNARELVSVLKTEK
ncbi:MAG: hypothetical protein M1561_03820 [Gammaproteobacteria bacterium]|nr:hypothetical protein [Gammaproteobacteria bacterium]